MAIYKAKVDTEYTVIPNATAQDSSLTFDARGLLGLMLSLPDDWEIHKSWLEKQAPKCGRDKLTRIMVELQNAGYINKSLKKSPLGKIEGVDWFVYPAAQLKNRRTENPEDGKPATTKETLITKEIFKQNDQSKIDREKLEQDSFDHWWDKYPKKQAKIGAFKSWGKVIKGMNEEKIRSLTNHICEDVKTRMDDLETGSKKYIGFDNLNATTYLNQERYNDDI